MTGINVNLVTLMGRLRVYVAYSFWIWPAISAVAAVAIARYTSTLDVTIPIDWGGVMTTSAGAGARDMVQTVAGAALTVATLVFSVTVAALQIAASQYSPRVPARFLRDTTTKMVMSIFIFTFVYSLSIVRAINAGNDDVPQLAVSISFILVLLTVGGFIQYIHHIINQLRVEQILSFVEGETKASVDRLFADREEPAVPEPEIEIPAHAQPIRAAWTGIVQRVDAASLVGFAAQEGIVVCFSRSVGSRITPGLPVAWIWTPDPEDMPADPDQSIDKRQIRRVLQLGEERALRDDVEFGLVQMVDIALRALSKAINDPTTAVNVLKAAEGVLIRLTKKCLGAKHHYDGDGTLRVIVPDNSFEDYVDMVVTPILRAAPDERSVMEGLCRMLARVARATEDPEHLATISYHIDLVTAAVQRHMDTEAEIASVKSSAYEVRQAIKGRPPRLP